ncbi:MAG: mechanosensitive ion channel family protein [Acidobacteria bacterium]|nr:mechanosensitive ion channel family protein [Acidobacteriota bacterium]
MWNEIISRLDVEALVTEATAFIIGYIPDVVVACAVLIGFWLFYRVSSLAIRGLLTRSGIHTTLISMLVDNVYRYTVLGFGIIMAADQIGVNVGAALAGIGVVGIAVGFAAQDTLSNIIAGFLIFLDKPFMVGDWLHVADQVGEVAEITMRTTRIRTKNNTWVVIPNKKIIDEVLVNHSKHGETRLDVPIGIAYKEHIPQAREVLLQAVQNIEGIVTKPEPQVVVTGLGASSVDLEVRVWISVASNAPPLYTKVLEVSKLALDEAGIEIPFPHLQLFFDDVRPAVWNGLKENVQAIRTQ